MSEEIKTEAPVEEEYKFPNLGNGPAVCYEKDKHQVWIGIPLERVLDPVMLMACLDRAKYDSLIHLSAFQQQMAARQQLSLGAPGKIKKTIKDIFTKITS